MGLPCGSDGKEFPCNAGDPGSVPELGRFPGGENCYPLQYSCLENPMDRGSWWAIVLGVAESDMTEPLTVSHTKNVYARLEQEMAIFAKQHLAV